jgi:hypothetical protein
LTNVSAIRQHPEFVPEWDVLRDEAGDAITYGVLFEHMFGTAITCSGAPEPTEAQLAAIRRAVDVWAMVCDSTDSSQARAASVLGRYDWNHPNMQKSRLLGRMIHQGLPPTRTKPPIDVAGPAWWLLPGGDPFGGEVGPTHGPFFITIDPGGDANGG